ncbi:hypothetical protein GOBAR_AA32993 [Gossypium barbadense]|uniref:Uncharacterized protein n=1 Tax=Gossypium barbadense TaxID=3634 RepID=A0A2P5W9I9_GOSBA|nr:hypothetical protein GOBAR_AA32993 [Gossypium barbadense]
MHNIICTKFQLYHSALTTCHVLNCEIIVVPTIDSNFDMKMIDSGADAKREMIWVDAGVKLPPPIVTTNEQTQLDPMNADLNTFGEVPLHQLIASLDLPNESFLHGWSSDLNLK